MTDTKHKFVVDVRSPEWRTTALGTSINQLAFGNLILVKEYVYTMLEVLIAEEAMSWLLLSWVNNLPG